MAAVEAYGKNDTYIFYATDELNPRPVRFEMQGYDILLTSYYDHYIVDYNNFTAWKYDSEIFDIPQGATSTLLQLLCSISQINAPLTILTIKKFPD